MWIMLAGSELNRVCDSRSWDRSRLGSAERWSGYVAVHGGDHVEGVRFTSSNRDTSSHVVVQTFQDVKKFVGDPVF